MKINTAAGLLVDFVVLLPRSDCGDSFVCPKHNESLSTHKRAKFAVIMSSLLRHLIKHQGALMLWLDGLTGEEYCVLEQLARLGWISVIYMWIEDIR